MIITYHGKGHIKLVTGDTTISLSPVSKESKKRQTKYGSDIAMIPINLPDYNGYENVDNASRSPFVIRGAGEYEVAGIFVNAFSTSVVRGGKDYITTSYVFNFDGMRVAYLGQITGPLAPEHKEIIDEVDVLFVPVGGDDLNLNPYDANKIAVGLEPHIIIPVDYDEKTLPIFLKEGGTENIQALEKLTIKKKDILDKQSSIILLEEI